MKHARKLLIGFLLSLLTLAFSASAWAFCGNGQGYYCKDYRYPCPVSDICEPGMYYCLQNILTQQALAQQAAIDTSTTTSTAVIADEAAPMPAVSDDYYAYPQPAPMPCQSYQTYGGHHGGGHHGRHH